ncbi:Uncharacterized protein dnm_004480 [Desulfonema magnum]|uniref:Uncharacterized protein n=1 Tax=Desulfonema magnum TaxID=45655 RepID=A0A975BFG9_9BACT|nr:Uncharacterized protein dnm_004480 [Desulfonema magnum]
MSNIFILTANRADTHLSGDGKSDMPSVGNQISIRLDTKTS